MSVYNNTMENKNIIWYILGLIVIIVIAALVWNSMQSSGGSPSAVTNSVTNNSGQGNTDPVVIPNEAPPADATDEEQQAFEEDRLEAIAAERARLLAEQESLQSAQESTSTPSSQADAERQAQIERDLLELKNQEEYPPLPDPGL